MRVAEQDRSKLEVVFGAAQKLLPKCPEDGPRDDELASNASGSASPGPAPSA